MKETLYALVQPTHVASAWYVKSIAGIEAAAAQHGLQLLTCTAFQALPSPPPPAALVIGAQTSWTKATLRTLSQKGVKPVVVGGNVGDFAPEVSGPTLNRFTLTQSLMEHYVQCGRRHIASIGHDRDDFNDVKRMADFLRAAQELGLCAAMSDVYFLRSGLDECILRFLGSAAKYDGVICVNDYVAVRLIELGRRLGISIPRDLFVAGSGDFLIGQCCLPSLTSSVLNYEHMGRQAVKIYLYLLEEPGVLAVNVSVPCEILRRQSTQPGLTVPPVPQPSVSLPEDPGALRTLMLLESCLLQCDKLDQGILLGVMAEESTGQMADRLYVSNGTVSYRMKKLYAALNVPDRKALSLLLRTHLTNEAFLGSRLF